MSCLHRYSDTKWEQLPSQQEHRHYGSTTYGDNATHDKGAALHSYFSLFTAKGLVVSEWRTEGRETHPPVAFLSWCGQCLIVYLWYTAASLSVILPLPCFRTIKYSCKPRYSVLVNQRAFQTDFAIYRPKTALKSVSSYFGGIHPFCGSFKGNKHTWKSWFRLMSFLSHFGNK